MKTLTSLPVLIAVVFSVAGCETVERMMSRPNVREMAPVNVGGTNFPVYELSDSYVSRSEEIDGPNAHTTPRTVAVYADVGSGQRVYCGPTAQGCADAIRRYLEAPALYGEAGGRM